MQKALVYIIFCLHLTSSCYAGITNNQQIATNTPESRQKIFVDTVSFPNRNYFNNEDSTFFGYKHVIADISLGSGQSGYVVYQDQNSYKVALTDGTQGVWVCGIVQLPDLKENEEFVSYLYYSDAVCNEPTFGIIKKDSEGKIHTIKAWKVTSPDTIEEIVPETIDFTESYETDPD